MLYTIPVDFITSILVNILTFILAVCFIIATLVMLFFVIRKILIRKGYKKHLARRLEKKDRDVLLIKIPPNNDRREDAMEFFLRSLHRLLPNGTSLSLEMISSDQFLHFYIVINKKFRSLLESQLYADYPDIEVELTKDSMEFMRDAAFVEIGFKHSSVNPIKTYQEIEEDLLKNLSAILSKTEQKEKVFLQLVIKRVGSKFYQRGLLGATHKMANRKGMETKMDKDLYMGKLRLGYLALNQKVAMTKLNTILNLLKSVKGSNELKKKNRSQDELYKACVARLFEQGDFWTFSEIATIYHFPYKGGLVSNVVNTTSKRAPAPDILPRDGSVSESEISIFGETNYRNEGKRFGIKRMDRRRHLYVVGKTGSGKSRLIELLLISDIKSGQGCCLLDPHGDLATEILNYVPKNRIKDVVYVNPADRDFPIGFNPLEPVKDPEMRQHLSSFFISIFKKMFAATWNEQMEHLIRYITLALLETPDSNILGIPRILSDVKYRQRVIKQIQDPVVKSFWINEFSSWNERFSNTAVIPILNKVGQFVSNPIIRNMVGQSRNALKFDEFMDTGKIVIINVSKGKLGEENAALLGSMFITKIQQAALARASIREEERRDFYFYVDEFQNFATDAFSSILSEARKYHLDLTIAHQYIAQLPEDVKATAFGNVGSMIAFAVGGDDAKYLSNEFAPTFSAEDMINLHAREMYIKMSVDGKLTPPFSASTINIPPTDVSYAREIVEYSRMTYGSNKTSVENEIYNWSNSASPISSEGGDGDFPEPIV